MLAPHIEDHPDVPFAARRAGRADGLPVLSEPEARADHGIEPYLGREAEGEPEAPYLSPP